MNNDSEPSELRLAALYWLTECSAVRKAEGVRQLAKKWLSSQLKLNSDAVLTASYVIPGRPIKPELVTPLSVKRRSMNTAEGRGILIHALAHIEFNAINLALDVIWRFSKLPPEFYTDWLKVADEEAKHFSMLTDHLTELGYFYGDFPAHNSLWEMAEKTQHDVLARIALVPRVMEARGLDATPPLRAKLAQAGDIRAAEILDIILHDEVGHVRIGNRWYAYLCAQRGLEPVRTFADLSEKFAAPILRGPINVAARQAAGFSEAELASFIAQIG